MGNCVFGGVAGVDQVIKVATSNGGLMEFDPPITVEFITNEFPGHGIFRSDDIFGRRQPLLHNEELLVGKIYYLLPLLPREDGLGMDTISMVAAPYRMSFENHGVWKRFETEGGIWKVKLAISAEKLAEILSQEAPTEALIESVRTVAKCRNGSSSAVSSDQWSLASSTRKGSWDHLA